MNTTKNLLTAAINLDVVDTAGLIDLVCEHDNDTAAILEHLDSIADALQHTDSDKRSAWIGVRDAAFWFNSDVSREAEDKWGFLAEARAKCVTAFKAAGLTV